MRPDQSNDMLPWGRDKASWLGLAETGLGLSGSGSDVGGQSSGGRGEWPGTLTGPSSHPLRHPHPGTFIICHHHRGSGDRGETSHRHGVSQTSWQRNHQRFLYARLYKSSKLGWGSVIKILFTLLRSRLWRDVTSVTLSRGGQRSDHSKARELLRQYKPRDIEDNIMLSSNHKVTSATSYKMTSSVSSLFCESLSPVTTLSSWIRSPPGINIAMDWYQQWWQ